MGSRNKGDKVDSTEDLLRRLEQLNAIGAALSKERDITRLLESILVAAKTITHADGGTLYRVTPDGRELRFEILRTDSLQIAMGGSSGNAIHFADLPLHLDKGKPNDRQQLGCKHDDKGRLPRFFTSGGRRLG